jgi:hypothetical protein
MIKWCGDVPKYYCNETNVRLKSMLILEHKFLESQLSGLLLKIDGNEMGKIKAPLMRIIF